ncbi:alpha/beta fold hydrolase [bacterium]|nr:alpha/beta fold hydrolase [bacterium]
MRKVIIYLLLMLSLLSCNGNSEESEETEKLCNPSCNRWEYCINEVCTLKKGRCSLNSDCLDNQICSDLNWCEDKIIDPCDSIECNSWESCVDGNCILTNGKCYSNSDCGYYNFCDATHSCDFDIKIVWESCPSYLKNAQECATVMMPFDYNNLNSYRVPVFIYRHKSASQNRKGAIWFLAGGPGGSGAIFDDYFKRYKIDYPDWDLYSIDHRGVGNSEKLTCLTETELKRATTTENDIEICVQELKDKYGENIKNFSTRGAANDLGKLISLLKKESDQIFIYGVSYGTFWAHRYLQLYPNQANGVILDSIALNGYAYLDKYDYLANRVGKKFIDICENDSICSEKMRTIAETPWEALKSVFNKVDNRTLCPQFREFTSNYLRELLLYLLAGGTYTRDLIPPFIYRLNRCSSSDIEIINSFINTLFGYKKGYYIEDESELRSIILQMSITYNELWDNITVDEALSQNSQYFFSTNGVSWDAFVKNSNLWPSYKESLLMEYSSTDIPILMLNGTLDPQTPLEIALPAKEIFNKTNQIFIEVPNSAHSILTASKTVETLENGITCGERIIFEFINNPTESPSLECLNDIIPVQFGDTNFNRMITAYFFKTNDMWEGSLQKNIFKENSDIENSLKNLNITHYTIYKNLRDKFINSF